MFNSSRRFRTRPIAAIALASAGLAITQPAGASIIQWTNGSGGIASNPNNWSGGVLPTPSDTVEYSLPGAYTVVYNVFFTNTGYHRVRRGDVTLRCAAPHFTGGDIHISAALGANTSLTLDQGTLGHNSTVIVGESDSSSGTRAFAWRTSGGMLALPNVAGAQVRSQALGISSNSLVIVGAANTKK